MYRGATVAVVVPAYNEEGFVGEVIDTIPEFVDRVYAIDDASTDGTWAEIRRHSREANDDRSPEADLPETEHEGTVVPPDRFVVPVRHAENGGRGRCVKDGYRLAREMGFDVTAVMDGDGQMDPGELNRILDPVVTGEADYAKGTRLKDRSHLSGMSRWRLFGNLILSFLTNLSSGYWGMADSQNGYTAVSLEALETLPVENLYDGYGFLNDILTTLNVHGFRIAEVPHPAVYADEESGIRYASFVPSLSALLLVNFLRRLRSQYVTDGLHATVVCYLFGTVAVCVGLVGAIGATLTTGVALAGVVPAPVLLVAGPVVLLLAVLLDIQHNSDLAYRSDTRPDPGSQQ